MHFSRANTVRNILYFDLLGEDTELRDVRHQDVVWRGKRERGRGGHGRRKDRNRDLVQLLHSAKGPNAGGCGTCTRNVLVQDDHLVALFARGLDVGVNGRVRIHPQRVPACLQKTNSLAQFLDEPVELGADQGARRDRVPPERVDRRLGRGHAGLQVPLAPLQTRVHVVQRGLQAIV